MKKTIETRSEIVVLALYSRSIVVLSYHCFGSSFSSLRAICVLPYTVVLAFPTIAWSGRLAHRDVLLCWLVDMFAMTNSSLWLRGIMTRKSIPSNLTVFLKHNENSSLCRRRE